MLRCEFCICTVNKVNNRVLSIAFKSKDGSSAEIGYRRNNFSFFGEDVQAVQHSRETGADGRFPAFAVSGEAFLVTRSADLALGEIAIGELSDASLVGNEFAETGMRFAYCSLILLDSLGHFLALGSGDHGKSL